MISAQRHRVPTPDLIDIEVVYASPEGQVVRPLTVAVGTTAVEAVELSDIGGFVPGLVWDRQRLGIFSRRVEPDQVLAAGDRVEIYRPLTLDPMEARRRRARDA
jgi:uncharacterized protein